MTAPNPWPVFSPTEFELSAGSENDGTALTFTGSIFFRTTAGSGTIHLRLRNATGDEFKEIVCNIGTDWRRFALAVSFTGVTADAVVLEIVKRTGDFATVVAWGANVSQNPKNDGRIALFPYVRRIAEDVSVLSVNASRCTAPDAGNGKRCSYSAPTCQDLSNFNFGNEYETPPVTDPRKDGFKTLRFCTHDSAMPLPGENVYPYLDKAEFAAQEIYPDKTVTTSDRAQMDFFDDFGNMGNINADRASLGMLTNTDPPRGTFWRRFMFIYANYTNPLQAVRVYDIFAPSDVSQLQLRGAYVMTNVQLDHKHILHMQLTDRLNFLRQSLRGGQGAKAPQQISQTNRLVGSIGTGDTVLTFSDTSELTALSGTSLRSQALVQIASGDYPVVIEVDFDNANAEFMNVTQNDLGASKLNVQRGRWGTVPQNHSDQAKWREVLMCGTENATPSNEPLGKNAIDITIELLKRGLSNVIPVDTATLFTEKSNWVTGSIVNNQNTGKVFKRAGGPIGSANSGIVTPTDVEVLLRSIRETLQLDLWLDEDEKVTGKIFAPPLATVAPTVVDGVSNFVADSQNIDDNQELSHYTRIIFATNLITGKTGTNLEDYNDYITYLQEDDELPFNQGVPKTKVILSPWVIAGDSLSAQSFAAQAYARYHKSVRKIAVDFEIKDDHIKVGDYLLATWAEIVDQMGDPIMNRFAQILRKQRSVKDNRFSCLIYDLGILDRYFIIAPDSLTPNYDDATVAERRYGYICNDSGRVGSNNDPGYRIIWI